eukprot:862527-Alexandrium_andersonii.AAC.1
MAFVIREKASGKVHPGAILAVLRPFGVPEGFARVEQALLASPMFRLEVDSSKSDWGGQDSGIRQGCTLPPFLFVLVLTALMRDVTSLVRRCRPPVGGAALVHLGCGVRGRHRFDK